MSLLDSTFLRIETRETPMHVAALQTYRIPEGAGDGFVREAIAAFRTPGPLADPFGLVLRAGARGAVVPTLVRDRDVDLEYHVRHTALPVPGGERQLGELVSHLHGVTLDRSRPLWTCHVIEGLEGNRFAIYLKIHHALTDGVGAMRLITAPLATTPDGRWSAPWQHGRRGRDERPARPSSTRSPKRAITDLARTTATLGRAYAGLARRPGNEPVRLPFEAPPCVLNGTVTAARRVATQQLDLARVKAVAKRTDTSINDVFLTICSTALRRHMSEAGSLPSRSLIAGVPVSLREPGDTSANSVGVVWASLGTDIDDDGDRLAAVHRSMTAAKAPMRRMTPAARRLFTMSTMVPTIGVLASGLGGRVRPPMNVTISNVPGPAQPRYLAGAQLEAFYPISIPVQGQRLNITCLTYDGQLNIGITGSRDAVPHLQRIAVYALDALEALECGHRITTVGADDEPRHQLLSDR